MSDAVESIGSVRIEDRLGVRWVTLHRPPVNALTLTEYGALADAFTPGGGPQAPRVVVLRAVGRVWSAGQDTAELTALDDIEKAGYLEVAGQGVAAAVRCPVPVVTALHGPAIGAGALLVAASDVVLATEQASLAFPEVRLGMHLGMSLLDFLPRPMAFSAMSTGQRISAQRLVDVGMVETLVPAEALETETSRRVGELLSLPDSSLRWLRAAADPEAHARAYEKEVSAVARSLREGSS